MLWIDANDLKSWASRRDCEGHLPLVIRRLVWATATDISYVDFPALDGVNRPGWDGILSVSEGTEYLPEGFSVWEISSNEKIKDKADKDYRKRREDPLGATPSETTFVFITPRKWSGRDEWCREKRTEDFWKDVRVYDAGILEQWLEQAPAIGAWLARHIGKYPEGATALEDWWDEWSSVTEPPLTPEVLVAGRGEQLELVRRWMSSPPSPLAVRAVTSEEALAFLAALVKTLPEHEQEFYLSRSLVAEDSRSFRHISVTARAGLLLIPRFEEIEGAPPATRKGHHVYVPLGPDNKITSENIELPRPERKPFVSALRKMGLSEADSEKHSKETGRSLTVLRRRLTKISNQPEWAKPDSARDIVPALLAGRWTEKKDADKEIVSQLARTSYETFGETLSSWLHKPDAPILKIGESWRLVSAIDAWFAIAPFLTPTDLRNLKKAVHHVLGNISPALDLEPEKRWMASVYGKVSDYSGALREGLAQTLVLLSVWGDSVEIQAGTTARTLVDGVVQELLHNADWKLWCSLRDVLPLIAEASPSSFLDAVESSLSRAEPPIMGMFSETADSLTSSSPHPSLLWALEGLAWSPNLLGRVTLILGKLARLDPGGKLSNRPSNTLRTVFLLWRPQTYASLEERLEAIDALLDHEDQAGWHLLIDLMPRTPDICSPTYKPRWRELSEKTETAVTVAEHWNGIKATAERLLASVGEDGHRWVQVLKSFFALPPEVRRSITQQLASCARKISDGRYALWNKLRYILSRHRSFPDEKAGLSEQDLKEIEETYSLLEPSDTILRFMWLFDSHWPDLPEGRDRDDFSKTEKVVAEKRLDAVRRIRSECGLAGLVSLAEQTDNPWLVGYTVANECLGPEEVQELLSLLGEEDEKKLRFAMSYVSQQAYKKGLDWIKTLSDTARSQRWPPMKTAHLFVAFPQNQTVWKLLGSFSEVIQQDYWRQCDVRLFDLPSEDKSYAIRQLLHVRRHSTALDTAAMFAEEMPTELIVELLLKAATETSSEQFNVQSYDVERLFQALDKSGEMEKVIPRLEWLYLPILSQVGSGRPPRVLHRELSHDPVFFAKVIKYVYKPRGGKKEGEDEALPQELLQQRAQLAWDLLHTWKTVPGTDDNGLVDYEELKVWVDKARVECKRLDRKEVGDIHIGQVLAHSTSEDQELWPPEPVCKIIDKIQSDELDRGFCTGIYSKRGIVTKSAFEGGQQERALAEQYRRYAEKWTNSYPRVAGVLMKIAAGYENEAQQEDQEAERDDLEY